MLNPIKRVWVPKNTPQSPQSSQAGKPPVAPKNPEASTQVQAAAQEKSGPNSKRGSLFDELPEPEVSEEFSDSIWAEFNSGLKQGVPEK